jgi:hypothetical protein
MPKSLVRLSLTHQLWLSKGDESNGGVSVASHAIITNVRVWCNVKDFVKLKWPFSDHLTFCFPGANAMVTFKGLV